MEHVMPFWESIKNTISSLFDDVSGEVEQRAKSPFFASFAISFLVLNAQILIVVFSAGEYEHKIAYINHVILPTTEEKRSYLLWYPLLAAAAYSLVWPIVDIGLAALASVFAHWKARVLLMAQRKKPFDAAFQASYFEQWEKEMTEAKQRMTREVDSRIHSELRMRDRLGLLEARLAKLTFRRIATAVPGGLSADDVEHLLQSEPATYEGDVERRENLRSILPHIRPVIKLMQDIEPGYIPPNGMPRSSIEEILLKLECPRDEAADIAETLYALKLAAESTTNGGQFQYLPDSGVTLARIRALCGLIPERDARLLIP